MASADMQWLFYSSERIVVSESLVFLFVFFLFFFCFFFFFVFFCLVFIYIFFMLFFLSISRCSLLSLSQYTDSSNYYLKLTKSRAVMCYFAQYSFI